MAQIIEAALRTPSSRSLNPWEFVVVAERERLERLAQAKPHGASFLKSASLAIVIQPHNGRYIGKSSISVVLIQEIGATNTYVGIVIGVGYVEIQITIVVIISPGNTVSSPVIVHTRIGCCIREGTVSVIPIQTVRTSVID